ncbi:N-methyl-L-tryptophan oxidase [Williamsia sp. CHRR-6]|uniref:N-methyl-L-tryptophan oxidase n=1 Tax=Williamsia sp. CHRR-6 TaxID=2835871 RepID=UPI001BDA89EC|nr:N-methyl-L-tryptophan oxidase [Williamsia sp. CHRR-6]MBT0566803.1 N-methyl-L-tryptophan oxidase [Williamsia sp. CHRR-6]
MTDVDLAIVGVGSVGSMALWQAARAGVDVLGLEAATPAHTRSAAGGDTRLFRMTFRGDADYHPILSHAQRLWRELESDSGAEIFTQCGGLAIGEEHGRYLPELLASIRRTPAPYEFLDHHELSRRYPQHALGPDECGVFDPEAGFLRTDQAVLSAVRCATEAGATVISGATVGEVTETPRGVRISTDTATYTAARVILSPGGWASALLPESLRAHVRPHRTILTWFATRHPEMFSPSRFPIFIRITADKSMYGAPSTDGATVKATLDGRSSACEHPDTVDRALSAAEIDETIATATEYFPDLYPTIVRSDVWGDLHTDDGHGLVGFAPGSQRIYLGTGFSGAGFKMAPAFGAVAATEALGGDAGIVNVDFLRPNRFH